MAQIFRFAAESLLNKVPYAWQSPDDGGIILAVLGDPDRAAVSAGTLIPVDLPKVRVWPSHRIAKCVREIRRDSTSPVARGPPGPGGTVTAQAPEPRSRSCFSVVDGRAVDPQEGHRSRTRNQETASAH